MHNASKKSEVEARKASKFFKKKILNVKQENHDRDQMDQIEIVTQENWNGF